MDKTSLEPKMLQHGVSLLASHIKCVLWYNDSLYIYEEILYHYLEPKYTDAHSLIKQHFEI